MVPLGLNNITPLLHRKSTRVLDKRDIIIFVFRPTLIALIRYWHKDCNGKEVHKTSVNRYVFLCCWSITCTARLSNFHVYVSHKYAAEPWLLLCPQSSNNTQPNGARTFMFIPNSFVLYVYQITVTFIIYIIICFQFSDTFIFDIGHIEITLVWYYIHFIWDNIETCRNDWLYIGEI